MYYLIRLSGPVYCHGQVVTLKMQSRIGIHIIMSSEIPARVREGKTKTFEYKMSSQVQDTT